MLSFQASPKVPETGSARRSGSSSLSTHPHTPASLPGWTDKYAQTTSLSHVARGSLILCVFVKYSIVTYELEFVGSQHFCFLFHLSGDVRSTGQPPPNIYSSDGNECTPKTRSTGEITKCLFIYFFVWM